ncbi:MATH domain and coiled-coil domain-containing protein At1g31390-like [Mercurialis annua]|uniref:MATH domain and coiled-coil domain-containing protein At1g31390-like n=1 Tax=Mercurialis annua TaxID=3986 RepID=UPI002160B9F0|nr:MATH domain and coiled-coil domain-containing protein At1g31390-like [Mercurialis annua]
MEDESIDKYLTVQVMENASKGECLSLVKKPPYNTYTWTIAKFSELDLLVKSNKFAIGGSNGRLRVYPKGLLSEKGKSLSIFLALQDDATLEHGRKLYVEYMLRLKSSKKANGFPKFMPLSDLNDKSKGFIHNNTLVVELEILAMTLKGCLEVV